MKHIDKNSLKHFGVCFILSLLGLYGVAFALGASICKEWRDKASYGHWCWWKKGLNELADKDYFTTITKRINGGTNGISDRFKYLSRAKKVLL